MSLSYKVIKSTSLINIDNLGIDALFMSSGTPLHYAIEYCKSAEIIKLLITKGKADVNAVDKYNETPLHNACRFGEADIVKLLITKGNADVNAVDEKNRTPLFHAVERSSEIVNILLTNGAKTDVVDKHGNTPLLLAIEKGRLRSTEVIKLLITKGNADVNAVDESYGTPLHSAVERYKSADIIKLLITKGKADVNAVDEKNRTPLFHAVEQSSEIVNILLTNGAKTDVMGENRTPLFHAVERSSEIVNILLTNGAITDVVDKYRINPELSRSEIAELLITKMPKYGNTPLLLAIEKGESTEVIKLLITKGQADVTAACEKYCINPELSRSEITELLIITKMRKSMFSSLPESDEMLTKYDDDTMVTQLITTSMSSSLPQRKLKSSSHYDDEVSSELVSK
ncbi:PREDICTED: tankyrase-like [Amphimedon queenslandica]|uniref:Ankyrin repeat protein n=1 Tax=Amphimedon queenslandica TaxID=400682 RepID=A0AAN0JFR5_AMPQE|nr:PREDICTED: tankyrase-like [Amphimedon queenslandica]|eukprot:XP_019855632.1 PREDICTED: tankyrase-like [Amphimedon queenslandica]